MYNNIKSCVRVGKTCSNLFPCLNGLRQGENLSPILFSIYLNDLHDFFSNSGICNGFSIPNELNEDYNLFLKMFVLLYADDTVLLGSTADDLQNALDLYENYYNTWKLSQYNEIKSSRVFFFFFSKGRQGTYNFTYNQAPVETLNEYKYFGIIFSRYGSFYKTKQKIANQATRTMYSLLRKMKRLVLPTDTQIDLFEKTVKPILLYGCELWAFENNQILKKVQLKFLKYILNIKSRLQPISSTEKLGFILYLLI